MEHLGSHEWPTFQESSNNHKYNIIAPTSDYRDAHTCSDWSRNALHLTIITSHEVIRSGVLNFKIVFHQCYQGTDKCEKNIQFPGSQKMLLSLE